jgi:hypothetical protein
MAVVLAMAAALPAAGQPQSGAGSNAAVGGTDNRDNADPKSQNEPAVPKGPQPGAGPQRAVLYEEDPTDPTGKSFVGSVSWRAASAPPGSDQSTQLTIRADIEVPERKLAITWTLSRNTDPAMPASHIIEIIFKLPAGFGSGDVSAVPGVLMKPNELARGRPLVGISVKVTKDYFMFGLSAAKGDTERNLQLLSEEAWFDIPIIYANGRRAILAIEKGTEGRRVFGEALAAWRQ